MPSIEYLPFDQLNPADFLPIVNQDSLRTHLIEHPQFDLDSVTAWMNDKIETGHMSGCRVRAVIIDGELAGWCGIQPDDSSPEAGQSPVQDDKEQGDEEQSYKEQGFELAIVIAQDFWGAGIRVFKDMMGWALELGHDEVVFHLLDTRRDYRALQKMATQVYSTEMLGQRFTSYRLRVEK